MAKGNGIQRTKVTTGKVRLSYAHLFAPYSNREDIDPKYSTAILVSKKDKATVAALKKAEKNAIEDGISRNLFTAKDVKLGKIKSIIHDGDTDQDLEDNPEYEGCLYLTVSSRTKPGIVDRNLDPIIDSTELYSGAYVRVSLNAFPYSVQGSKGVSFGLNNVQKLADGEPLGGRTRAEDDFDAIDDDEDEDEDDELL